MYKSEASKLIPVEFGSIWTFVSNIENYPRFIEHLVAVEMLGDQTSQWYLKSARGLPNSCKTVSIFEPARAIDWHTLPGEGSLEASGFLEIEPEAEGTRVTLSFEYNPLGGAALEAFEIIELDAAKDLQRLNDLLTLPPSNTEQASPSNTEKTSATANPLESEIVKGNR